MVVLFSFQIFQKLFDLDLQHIQIALCDSPNNLDIDGGVSVDDPVPSIDDLSPNDLWICQPKFFGQVIRRLTDHLDVSYDRVDRFTVIFEPGKVVSVQIGLYRIDPIENIKQKYFVVFLHKEPANPYKRIRERVYSNLFQ